MCTWTTKLSNYNRYIMRTKIVQYINIYIYLPLEQLCEHEHKDVQVYLEKRALIVTTISCVTVTVGQPDYWFREQTMVKSQDTRRFVFIVVHPFSVRVQGWITWYDLCSRLRKFFNLGAKWFLMLMKQVIWTGILA